MNSSTDFPLTHFFICLILTLILTFLSWQGRLSWLTQPIISLTTPIRSSLKQINAGFNLQTQLIHQIPLQQRLIDDLKRQNAQLSVLAQKASELEKENASLRQLIKSPIPSSRHTLPVKIISVTRYAYLNQGKAALVNTGLPLVTADQQFLGLVTEVGSNTAKVILLTDPDFNLNVTTSQSVTGQLKFTNNKLQLTQILQKDSLNLGDRVFTQTSDQVPGSLLIGTVSQLDDQPSAIYKTATIKPSANITDVQNAFLILE